MDQWLLERMGEKPSSTSSLQRKPITACEICRQKKRRCDTETPCATCRRLSRACIRPQRKGEIHEILEPRVQRLESLISELSGNFFAGPGQNVAATEQQVSSPLYLLTDSEIIQHSAEMYQPSRSVADSISATSVSLSAIPSPHYIASEAPDTFSTSFQQVPERLSPGYPTSPTTASSRLADVPPQYLPLSASSLAMGTNCASPAVLDSLHSATSKASNITTSPTRFEAETLLDIFFNKVGAAKYTVSREMFQLFLDVIYCSLPVSYDWKIPYIDIISKFHVYMAMAIGLRMKTERHPTERQLLEICYRLALEAAKAPDFWSLPLSAEAAMLFMLFAQVS
ncbi:Zn(II)2Cys6 transcription factor domain-containing protein [Aspergillus novofumigatus IBT 16806]|uniref:C6 zinc finger domain protein n=1 Tax=Aspergillus novofumigatus (strain IBT 16806) TaxID=1392255 RepID=A0A2I1CJP6_ASPN1|nr:C6 zinc finger domain protein [Aspergillus novofumigatus IBT 16806]PKX97826.1 C6 zinc finger domain protein [Aspergillus novofumigatus IBT 16806]